MTVLFSLIFGVVACEKDARGHYLEGTAALSQKKYDEAAASYQKALELDPKNFDATIGLAEVFIKKGELDKAKEFFVKAKALGGSGAKQKYIDQLMQEMFLQEAKAIEDKTSDAFHDALWKIIKIRDRGPEATEAYNLLGAYYMERGDALAKEKASREKAVEMYQAFNKIRTQRTLRTEAITKSKKLLREIYKDSFAVNFEKIKGGLVKEGLYDDAAKVVKIKVLVEDKEIKPKTDEDKAQLKQKLSTQALFNLVKMTYALSGETVPPDNELKRLNFETLKEIEGSTIMEKGKAQLIISVTLADVEEVSYKRIVLPSKKAAKKKKAPAAAPKEAPKAPAPAANKADAGTPAAPTGTPAAPTGTPAAPTGTPAAPAADAGTPKK